MIRLADTQEVVSRSRAIELLASDPVVIGHDRAWIDDGELCLQIVCRMSGGDSVRLTMTYCWDVPEFRTKNYFADVTVWLLNDHIGHFYEFVRERLLAVLEDHAVNDYDFELD